MTTTISIRIISERHSLFVLALWMSPNSNGCIRGLITQHAQQAMVVMQSEGLRLMVWQNCPWHTQGPRSEFHRTGAPPCSKWEW